MAVKTQSRLSTHSQSSSLDATPHSYAKWWLRPQAHDRPPLYWHLLSRAFALGMWTVPRRYRFSAASMLARISIPVLKRTSWYRAKRQIRVDGAGEISLYCALEMISNSGALFDPLLEVEGAELLRDAMKRGRGVLIVSPHMLLYQLVFRYLYDIGYSPTVVSTAPRVHIYGTGLTLPATRPSPTFMIRLRSVLRGGGVVCAMVDGKHASAQSLIEFSTVEGPMYISDALLRLALRCNARILFISLRTHERRRVLLNIAAPDTSSGLTVESAAKDCVAFIQAHVAAVASKEKKPNRL